MKRLLVALACLATSPAAALDCGKAISSAEKLICSDARLTEADKALGAAYADWLAQAPDDEMRTMMVASQKRWLQARDEEAEPNDDPDDEAPKPADVLLDLIGNRTHALKYRTAGVPPIITQAKDQRAFAARFSGGPFAGYQTSCDALPPDAGYACFATRHYQNGSRVCSVDQYWASGTVYVKRYVADVVDGKPKLKASCSYNGDDKACPDMFGGEDAGWNTQPKQDDRLYSSAALPKIDGDVEDNEDADWLIPCLTQPDFPATR